jgi:hypothetical protein
MSAKTAKNRLFSEQVCAIAKSMHDSDPYKKILLGYIELGDFTSAKSMCNILGFMASTTVYAIPR